MKIIAPIFVVFLLLISCKQGSYDSPQYSSLKLWYKHPADATIADDPDGWIDDPEWLKALPLGNGSLGAMVFGDVDKERIQLNEETMWSGSPANNNNPDAYPNQEKIRKLLYQGNYKEAHTLTNATQICKGEGSGHGNGAKVPYGCFQTLGDLWIDFEKHGGYTNYHRELDLESATVRVSYTKGEVNYKREIFISEPDQVMVAKFTADKPGQLSFKCGITRPARYKTKTIDNQLVMYGSLTDGKGGDGLNYMTRLSAVNKKGKVFYNDTALTITNADEVTLFLTASTDYVLKYPDYKGRNYVDLSKDNLEKAKDKPFQELYAAHKNEYQNFYNRVSFRLANEPDTVPTDERIERFKSLGTEDKHLVELVFQYGRYLLISSSRPNSILPANLQGIWANKIQTPWNGDYHGNINIQMNYWPAEVTNLSEMHRPLFKYIESFIEPAKETAKIQYNANGWVLHPIANVWGYTAPGERAGWGMDVACGAWLSSHIGEHYNFTQDKIFLKRMYPVLKSSVSFYLDWLTIHPETGKWVSGPGVSPENTFIAPDGTKTRVSMGPAHHQQVIWQLFNDFLNASNVLSISDDFVNKTIEVQKNLARGLNIASDGRLMEWAEEFKELDPGHRHLSHLFALYPGNQIDVHRTPELALAAKNALDFRIKNGSGHTGWSAAWLISLYARLGEANNAEKCLNTVLAKSTATNLFGFHPPFQMDSNFGTTAGIAEMLIQSHSGEIILLPALPNNWKDGEVKGLCARGGFIIDMKWKLGKVNHIRVYSKKGGQCKLNYLGEDNYFMTEPEKEYFPMGKWQ